MRESVNSDGVLPIVTFPASLTNENLSKLEKITCITDSIVSSRFKRVKFLDTNSK